MSVVLNTYKDAVSMGMVETPITWQVWKRAFLIANKELCSSDNSNKEEPSDEEIHKVGWQYYQNNGLYPFNDKAFSEGAKWYRDNFCKTKKNK